MLIKKSLSLVFLASVAFGGNVENVEFLADQVEKNGEIIDANGNVLLYSQTYLATANKAKYDQANKIVELFGNVNMLKGQSETSRSNYAKINLKTNEVELDSSFAMDKSKELWIQSDESCSSDEKYDVKNSIVSSCNVQDPDWHIKFSSGELNKQSKFLHLYNPVFYVGDVPMFYLPYFGFSTDKTRRSGLLKPQIGYSGNEGLIYIQPVYVAVDEWWDLEFDPQIRTNRGLGGYSTFRFADSPYSNGLIRAGFFEEKTSYQEKEELKNKRHHGFEIEYDRDRLVKHLISDDLSEGLYLRYISLNDIDYLNLRGKGEEDYDSLVQSKLNYFLSSSENYLGVYGKYYIDTAKLSDPYKNKDTVQELPTIQYHSFLDTFIVPNLTYSFDSKYHNYTRQVGATASQYEFNVPVGVNFNVLNDFANFSVTENLYATHIDYNDNKYVSGNHLLDDDTNDYINHYHNIALETDLAKAYEDFYHTMNIKLDYIKPGYSSGEIDKKLLKYYMLPNGANLQNISDSLFEDNFLAELSDEYTTENGVANFTQYFYDDEGKKFLRHSIKQGYNFDDKEFNNLQNRLNLYLGNFTFANKVEYSHIYDRFAKIQTGVGYSNSLISSNIYHTYQEQVKDIRKYDKESYLTSSLSFKLPKNYKLLGAFDYDVEREYTKMWRLGLNYQRKCWNYTFIYQEDIEPKNTSAGLQSKKSQGFFLYFSFYPLGNVGYNFSTEQDNNEANQ
ncbi:putative lipooligosaccharide transport system, OM component (LptD family) [Campylobacter iguaniorum]|uniref:LPS-assembly protein LptD n=1 Tax=Campylobacter iguaniorum TaxID=1244531 RepID=UPI0007C892C6|nr:LPS assembly protein LptD [Campylobacter iguaniorum]ANE36250.1 putative lipooligosaccharide transport system, OM component (LptD family) [Campylobacter iguaniorum]